MIEQRFDGVDLLVLTADDAVVLAGALRWLIRLASNGGALVNKRVHDTYEALEEFRCRADGCAGATVRPESLGLLDDQGEVLDTSEAAALLGISAAAVRKRCERGRYAGVAGKRGGRWFLRRADIAEEAEAR